MAGHTVFLYNLRVEFPNSNWILKIARGKSDAMIPAVPPLGKPVVRKTPGLWQSLQAATALWLEWLQSSNGSRITWQFRQAFGSSEKYAAPSA